MNKNMKTFKGLYTALITPMKKNKDIDYKSLEKQ